MSNPTSGSAPEEKTFKTYSKDQGAHYANARPGYHPNLYKLIIDHHTSTGGKLDTLLDVGCGPGTSVCVLAKQFTHAIGLDPSAGMIETARSSGGVSSIGEAIRFEVASAEDLGSKLSPPVADASVDLITASTAAHWFDMPRFWPQAARVLKPGGTVAIWSTGESSIDPSVPNAKAIQAAMEDIRDRELVPFFEPGNFLTRDLYSSLPLPWTITPPVTEFEEATFFRKEYGPGKDNDFYTGSGLTLPLVKVEHILATSSPVQRWREAHPDAVGTEKDVIRRVRRAMERLLHEAGVEEGKEIVKVSLESVLLMVKKKA